MGRIKTQPIKRVSHELFEKHSDAFKGDFQYNSSIISQFALIKSKKVRNAISGYITRMAKAKKQWQKTTASSSDQNLS